MWKVDVYWNPLPPCLVAMNEKESRLGMISYHFEDSVLSQFFLISISYHFENNEYSFTTFVLGRDEQEIIAPENDFFHNIHDWL